MSTDVIVYVLTGLALVVIVLTRLRMGRGQGAGRVYVGNLLLNMHTGSGLIAIITWVLFLVSPEDSALGDPLVGIISLAFWWVVTICGLLMLVRWLPEPGTARLGGVPGQLVRGAGAVGPRTRRHAGGRVHLHVRLPDQRSLT